MTSPTQATQCIKSQRPQYGRARSRCQFTGKALFFELTRPTSENGIPANPALSEAVQHQGLGRASSGRGRMACFTAFTARRLRREVPADVWVYCDEGWPGKGGRKWRRWLSGTNQMEYRGLLGSSPSNALQAASCEGHEKVVELLLRKGAEVDAQSREYGNALRAASCEGHEKLGCCVHSELA